MLFEITRVNASVGNCASSESSHFTAGIFQIGFQYCTRLFRIGARK